MKVLPLGLRCGQFLGCRKYDLSSTVGITATVEGLKVPTRTEILHVALYVNGIYRYILAFVGHACTTGIV